MNFYREDILIHEKSVDKLTEQSRACVRTAYVRHLLPVDTMLLTFVMETTIEMVVQQKSE
jgi:hypothetical protein